MTYVSKKEKVFDLPEDDEPSSISLNKCETRLKRFPSISDRRAWTSEECQRYQHFYGLVNGTETNVSKSSSFKYIPFDVLLAILMAEKDAYIQELLERQEDSKSSCDAKANLLYKAEGFEDSDDDRDALIRKDAEVVSLKNKIAGLESELEDYRDTLTKAMHKLENMDSVIRENNLLREKIKCCEETIKCLEEKKVTLEKELECYEGKRSHNKQRPFPVWNGEDFEEIVRLSSERDILLQQVEDLQRDLEEARATAAETEVLRKISETTSCSLQEISKENENYKKKLEGMKFLEKHVEELKNQAHALTDKYKRESQKANDHLKLIEINSKELELLKEERNKLELRVDELSTYESQYLSLQAKLRQVELIIDENDDLNKKLLKLDRLESENRELKTKLEDLRRVEQQADDDKETIRYLQRAVVDQELEIEKMLKQIQDLSRGYSDKKRVESVLSQLEEKDEKLKKYEKQVMEIPVLEREVDGLRNKLQKCMEDFKTDKGLLRRLQEELETCRKRCRELEEVNFLSASKLQGDIVPESTRSYRDFTQNFKVETIQKGMNTTKIKKRDAESQSWKRDFKEKSTETLMVDLGIEKLKELENQNKALKEEIQSLHLALPQVNLDELEMERLNLTEVLRTKDEEIVRLSTEIDFFQKRLDGYENLKTAKLFLEERVKLLSDTNSELEKEIKQQGVNLVKIKELENRVKEEKKARTFAIETVKELEKKLLEEKNGRNIEKTISKLEKEEANIAKQELWQDLCKSKTDFREFGRLSRKLILELKKENQILLDMREYSEKTEKRWMKDLINKLKAEVTLLKSLSKPKIEEECKTLKERIIKIAEEADALVDEARALKSALECEQKAKEYLEKELGKLQAELSACVVAGTEAVSKEMAAKDLLVLRLQQELSDAELELEKSCNEARLLRDENSNLLNNCNDLKLQHKDLETELNTLLSRIEVLNGTIKAQECTLKQNSEEIVSCQNLINSYKHDLVESRDSVNGLQRKLQEMENIAAAKEEEIKRLLEKSPKVGREKPEKPDSEVSNIILPEKQGDCESEINFERDIDEKFALQEALKKMEIELVELKAKLKECTLAEDEVARLRQERDSLSDKVARLGQETDSLKEKLNEFENSKGESEEPKADESSSLESNHSNTVVENDQIPKPENLILKEKLLENENLKRTGSEDRMLSQTLEFHTPPALPSPRDSDANEENHVKIRRLERANAEKIKKLVEQHERETESMSKAYRESINNIKSSYESNIRKLVDKHKSSIMRLQSLHEDEVQELNTNYETQMEAMQTQNENVVNALKTESAEKCKHLVEQRIREVQEMKERYEEILKEKEARSPSEKSTAETDALKETHKQTLDSLTQFYQSNVAESEGRHANELKKCKKAHAKKLELVKTKYEALLQEERKKYEEQLEEMLFRIQNGQQGDAAKRDASDSACRNRSAANPRLEFSEVLQKIINEGLESLSTEEVILVHSKTCFVPEDKADPSPGMGDGCRHRALMTAEKEELLKRIFSLEHEVVVKQLETHEAIVNLETAEKYRVQELKNALCAAQQKNNELKLLLSNQAKLQTDLKIERYMLDKQAALHESSVVEKVKELEREKSEKRRLEEELLKERSIAKHLTAALETEKERFRSQRKRDAEYVNAIRIRLEEALNHEQMMESQLDYEARFRAKLELELQALQKNFNLLTDPPSAQVPEPKQGPNVGNDPQQTENTEEEFRSRSKSRRNVKSKGLHVS